MENVPWAAVAPILVLLAAFLIYCLVDLTHSEVQHLPGVHHCPSETNGFIQAHTSEEN